MVNLGFKHFVGVDGSNSMLELAVKTGLYQDLKLALLGTEPLPAQTGTLHTLHTHFIHTSYTLHTHFIHTAK